MHFLEFLIDNLLEKHLRLVRERRVEEITGRRFHVDYVLNHLLSTRCLVFHLKFFLWYRAIQGVKNLEFVRQFISYGLHLFDHELA